MGVEYKQVLLYPGRYRPSAERLANFMHALAAERWIAPLQTYRQKKIPPSRLAPWFRKTGATLHRPGPKFQPAPFLPAPDWLRANKPYVCISWSIVDVDALEGRFPVEPLPYFREGLYYDLEIRWSRHYQDIVSHDIDGFVGRCTCGADLERPRKHILEPGTYRLRCPQCDKDPASLPSGKYLHRFAVVADCGKNVPEQTGETERLHPALKALCDRAFHAPSRQCGIVG